jgi:two-component system response regulator GlrR
MGGHEGDEATLRHVLPAYLLRRVPVVTWSDSGGEHSMQLDKPTVVGSAEGAGIVIPNDRTLSRLHAELDLRDDGLWVRDLGSRNGTVVDGVSVECARVPNGGRVHVGATVLKVQYEETHPNLDLWPKTSFGPLLGESFIMRELFSSLSRISPMTSSVLINGETGTGKELVARAIHEASPRASNPFIIVDCAALPENLLDAELFGHTKGAFTGAISNRAGAIESADGGTVFLDEIGELPMSMQPKLLRVIESRMIRRLGESAHRKVDVRFLSATHRDLLTMVNAGEFREDLYFRLAVVPVMVPPLRKRPEDIETLVRHFMASNGDKGSISHEIMREVLARPWRGNVRELRNFVERALALGASQALAMTSGATPEPFANEQPTSRMSGSGAFNALKVPATPPSTQNVAASPGSPGAPGAAAKVAFDQAFKDFREQWVDAGEREYVQRLLQRHDRNVQAAAQAAGVDRTYIYRLIRKHGL